MSEKSACGGLLRQKLKKCLRPGAQTPRPPGKAGRYEFTLEDLRVLQTSPKGLFDSLRRGHGPRLRPPTKGLLTKCGVRRGLGQSPKALCRSIFHERCERPKDARNAAFSKFRGFSTV